MFVDASCWAMDVGFSVLHIGVAIITVSNSYVTIMFALLGRQSSLSAKM